MKKILIVAGGSGGHIFPALEIAKAFIEQGFKIHWLGSGAAIESRLVPSDYPHHHIPAKKLRGQGIIGKLRACIHLALSTLKSCWIIGRVKPVLVITMGSYVSGPAGLAAKLLGKPLVMHEQNAIPGLANRYLAKIATLILQTYPNTFPLNNKTKTTGNPIRAELCTLDLPEKRYAQHQDALRILVMGGSQGAKDINEGLVTALKSIDHLQAFTIKHQTGPTTFEQTQQAYQALDVSAEITPFINDVIAAYQWADLVICRSGATTLAEITAVGIASILIPYPYQLNDHQLANAQQLEHISAACVIAERSQIAEQLSQLLPKLAQNRAQLLTMAQAAKQANSADAATKIVAECLNIL